MSAHSAHRYRSFSQQRWMEHVRGEDTCGQPWCAGERVPLANLSVHHRAQSARLVRQQGHAPPAIDYILFYRREKA